MGNLSLPILKCHCVKDKVSNWIWSSTKWAKYKNDGTIDTYYNTKEGVSRNKDYIIVVSGELAFIKAIDEMNGEWDENPDGFVESIATNPEDWGYFEGGILFGKYD